MVSNRNQRAEASKRSPFERYSVHIGLKRHAFTIIFGRWFRRSPCGFSPQRHA